MKTLNLSKRPLTYLKNSRITKYRKKTETLINRKKNRQTFINYYLTSVIISIVVLIVILVVVLVIILVVILVVILILILIV